MIIDSAGKFGLNTTPSVGLHATGLAEGTGDFNDITAVFQGAPPANTQNGFLFTSNAVANDIWLAFRGVPADTNQWTIGARFFSGDTFAIGYGDRVTETNFPLGTGAKFVITTSGNVGIELPNGNRIQREPMPHSEEKLRSSLRDSIQH